jgi:hypothetical protein
VNLAEGEETVPIAAVVDEGGLQRRLDASNLGEVDVTLYLFLGRRLEIELFETVAVENHHPRLFRVSGIDEHAFCHSGITPGRAIAAARKSAGGAILSARKPPAPEAIPLSNEWTSVMGDSTGVPLSASGSYNPHRPALQPGAAAAVLPLGRACVASPYQVCRLAGGRRFFANTNV